MSLCTVTRIRVVRVLLGVLEKAALGFGVVLPRLGRLRRERHRREQQHQRHTEQLAHGFAPVGCFESASSDHVCLRDERVDTPDTPLAF